METLKTYLPYYLTKTPSLIVISSIITHESAQQYRCLVIAACCWLYWIIWIWISDEYGMRLINPSGLGGVVQ